MEFCRHNIKLCLERAWYPLWLKKDMELDEIKYLYLLFYTTIIGGVIFFNSYWKVKKAARIWDLELIKKVLTVLF
jgi:hypothetical protein